MNGNNFHNPRSKIFPQIIEEVEKERRMICSDRITPRKWGKSDKWDEWNKWYNWDNWDNWDNWSNW